MKKNVAFTLISFAVLKWDDCLLVQVPFELPVETLVQLLLELEANWLDQNVNELKFEQLESKWNDPVTLSETTFFANVKSSHGVTHELSQIDIFAKKLKEMRASSSSSILDFK